MAGVPKSLNTGRQNGTQLDLLSEEGEGVLHVAARAAERGQHVRRARLGSEGLDGNPRGIVQLRLLPPNRCHVEARIGGRCGRKC